MGSVFSKPKTPKPPEPTTDPAAEEAAAEAARREAERLRKKRRGVQGTILTGPLGVQGPATVRKTTLG